MVSKSESSTANSAFQLGIPSKCECGYAVKRYTSATTENPGRPFFRCETMSKKGHFFKWVEEALIEEVEEIKRRDEARQDDINKLRSDFDSMIHEFYDIHQYMLERNKENKKLYIGFAIGLCVGLMVLAFQKLG